MQKARKRKSGGFSLIEVIAALTVLAIAATAVAAGLISASASVGRAGKKSVANAIAQAELEKARALPYLRLGITGGNPDGNLSAVDDEVRAGLTYNIARRVSNVDDLTLSRSTTYFNRKRIDITVTRAGTSEIVKASTFVSPPSYETVANRGSIVVRLTDLVNAEQVDSAQVAANPNNPPLPILTDTTDTHGLVIFAGLMPSSSNSSSAAYNYSINPTSPIPGSGDWGGYRVIKADTGKLVHLPRNGVPQIGIKVFKPVSMTVLLVDQHEQTISDTVKVKVDHPGMGAYTLSGQSNGSQISQLGSAPAYRLEPSNGLKLQATNASSSCYEDSPASSPGLELPLGYASSYPATTSATYTLKMARYPDVTVHLNEPGTSIPAKNVPVTISGEPSSVTTDASGNASFTCVAPGSSVSTGSTWDYSSKSFGPRFVSTLTGPDNQTVDLDVNLVQPPCAAGARVTPTLRDLSTNSLLGGVTYKVGGATLAVGETTKCVAAPGNVALEARLSGFLPDWTLSSTNVLPRTASNPELQVRPACSMKITGVSGTVGYLVQLTPVSVSAPFSAAPVSGPVLNSTRNSTIPLLYGGVQYRVQIKAPAAAGFVTINGPYTCTAPVTTVGSSVSP